MAVSPLFLLWVVFLHHGCIPPCSVGVGFLSWLRSAPLLLTAVFPLDGIFGVEEALDGIFVMEAARVQVGFSYPLWVHLDLVHGFVQPSSC